MKVLVDLGRDFFFPCMFSQLEEVRFPREDLGSLVLSGQWKQRLPWQSGG